MIKTKENAKGSAPLSTITACFGLKRDVYYKYKRREDKRLKIEKKVVDIVKKKHRSLP